MSPEPGKPSEPCQSPTRLWLRQNAVLFPFLVLLALLAVAFPHEIVHSPSFVDWRTVGTLTGLMAITTALKETGVFSAVARRILQRLRGHRSLAFFLVGLSAVLAMFFTNDIALFIVVPLTLALQDHVHGDLHRLVVFEALAVNVGSTLTPIGNPQNLLLWHLWQVPFVAFVVRMWPLFTLQAVVLGVFVLLAFPRGQLRMRLPESPRCHRPGLFAFSLVLLVGFVLSVELHRVPWALPVVLALYALVAPEVLRSMDWPLLVLFVVMFVDFHLLAQVPALAQWVHHWGPAEPKPVFWMSLGLSQVMSNVPATIFMARFTHLWQPLAYGVNLGGNGLVIGSLANLIALRLAGGRRIWLTFHAYSLPFLGITALLALWWLV